jgi:hypothetical protein
MNAYLPVCKIENARIDQREEIAQCTEADVGCEYVIIVSVEELH